LFPHQNISLQKHHRSFAPFNLFESEHSKKASGKKELGETCTSLKRANIVMVESNYFMIRGTGRTERPSKERGQVPSSAAPLNI